MTHKCVHVHHLTEFTLESAQKQCPLLRASLESEGGEEKGFAIATTFIQIQLLEVKLPGSHVFARCHQNSLS